MANDAYFDSSKVKVFPSTNRYEYPQGKLTSEENFVNIINSITDYKSYVLEYPNSTVGTLKVIMGGYYFEIENFSRESNVWLRLVKERTNYSQLVSQGNDQQLDLNNKFYGLKCIISPNEPVDSDIQDPNNYESIKLQVSDSSGAPTNIWRFKSDSIKYVSSTNGSDRKLTDDLDRRQYVIKAGQGLQGEDNNKQVRNSFDGNNVIKIADNEMVKLNNLNSKGSDVNFIYFNKDGVASASRGNVGNNSVPAQSSSNEVLVTKDIILSNGIIKEGRSVYFSKKSPSEAPIMINAKIGDIWLKYQD